VADAFAVELGDQSEFVMRPNQVAQIIKQREDCHCLFRRPVRIDEQLQAVVQAGRLMM
jgi:hypothetical protein